MEVEKNYKIINELGTFHLHTIFSDGKNSIEEIVEYAKFIGLKRIGFSDHAPLPYGQRWTMKQYDLYNYLNEIKKFKNDKKVDNNNKNISDNKKLNSYKNTNDIEIYCGLEVDFIREYKENLNIKKSMNLDYIVGSIHGFLYDDSFYTIDGDISNFDTLYNKMFNGDIKELVKYYYLTQIMMVDKLTPDIVGHLDLIKLHNKNSIYFNENESWYKESVVKVLNKIKEKDLLIEINTGGYARNKVDFFYPSLWIMEIIKDLGIKIIINSDAHWKEMITAKYDEAIETLKKVGFKSVNVFKDGEFKEFEI